MVKLKIVLKYLNIKLIITFLLFCITIFLLFIDDNKSSIVNYNHASKEMFVPKLSRLNSINKMIDFTDSLYTLSDQTKFDTLSYVSIVSETIKRRFYHGISNYSLSENWILYVLGKICWSHISAIVKPDDILKHQEALCSQQNIVFTEILKSKGITSRAVGLGTKKGPGHFLTEVLYNHNWHLYDVDLEPNWGKVGDNHLSLDTLLKNKSLLYVIYNRKLSKIYLNIITRNLAYGKSNQFPAKNMLLFHQITFATTVFLPLFFLSLFLYFLYRNKKIRQ